MPAPQEHIRLLPIQLLQHERAKSFLPPALVGKADQARTHHDLRCRVSVRKAVDRRAHLLPQLRIEHLIQTIQQHLGAVVPQPPIQRLGIEVPAPAFGTPKIIEEVLHFTISAATGVIPQLDQQRRRAVVVGLAAPLRPGQHQILQQQRFARSWIAQHHQLPLRGIRQHLQHRPRRLIQIGAAQPRQRLLIPLRAVQHPLIPQAPLQLLRQLQGPRQKLFAFAHGGGDEHLRHPDPARHVAAGGIELLQLQVLVVLGHRLAVAREIQAGGGGRAYARRR